MKITLILFFLSLSSWSQVPMDSFEINDDELHIGGDIFSDFNEDIESSQMSEDERFYRYGRFFSFQIGIGLTNFTGNRGVAYDNDPPTYNLGLNYFLNFRNSFGMGVEFSKHNIFVDEPTFGYPGYPDGVGFIDISALRVYFSYRYYIDTADLVTAITYSNPYFTARLEYWYLTNKFIDQTIENDTGGGIGVGLGGGFEFPIKIKESYLGVEFLFHSVSFHDKFTQNYRDDPDTPEDTTFVDDLTGDVWSLMVSYVINW